MSETPPPISDATKGKTARNERRKATGTMLNALGVAALIGLGLQPFTLGRFDPVYAGVGVAFFIVSQFAMHYILSRLED